jgi:DNA-binding GntR family transcriptional regulator
MRNSRQKIFSMTDKAYTRLLMSIVTLEFPPGERLSLDDLIARFKIGRTPLREALIRLESVGLVEMHRRKSLLVSNITLQGVKSFFEIYQILEKLVSRLAAERASAEEIMRLKRTNAQMQSSFEYQLSRNDRGGVSKLVFDQHYEVRLFE